MDPGYLIVRIRAVSGVPNDREAAGLSWNERLAQRGALKSRERADELMDDPDLDVGLLARPVVARLNRPS